MECDTELVQLKCIVHIGADQVRKELFAKFRPWSLKHILGSRGNQHGYLVLCLSIKKIREDWKVLCFLHSAEQRAFQKLIVMEWETVFCLKSAHIKK